jgi:hypothetical protein
VSNNKKLGFVYSVEDNAAIKTDAADLYLLIYKDMYTVEKCEKSKLQNNVII